MAEGIPSKLNPNIIKGTAAALAIGSVAVPIAINESPAPKVANVELSENMHVPHFIETRVIEPHIQTNIDTPLRHKRKKHPRSRFTGYEVKGQTSTFGWPTDAYASHTADGGDTYRPCIAIRNDSTLDRMFQVTVIYKHIKHQADMPQCDWGPAAWTGRAIDITGKGVIRLHLNPWNYPTDHALGIARELKGPKVR